MRLLAMFCLSVCILNGLVMVSQADDPKSATPFDATVARTAAEAKSSQEAWAKKLGTPVVEKNSIGMELVLIPPGKFKMGISEDERIPTDEKRDPVEVTLTQTLYVGRTEVTQGQFREIMGTQPWKGKEHVKEGDRYAASYISWKDATAFCDKLTAKEGKKYRLLTEAEWEYACRAGSVTPFYFGDDYTQLIQFAWVGRNAQDAGENYPHEVGLKKPNKFGLFDMIGNVSEWCQDYYTKTPRGGENPLVTEESDERSVRPSHWKSDSQWCRSGARGSFWPADTHEQFGFRVVQVRSVKTNK